MKAKSKVKSSSPIEQVRLDVVTVRLRICDIFYHLTVSPNKWTVMPNIFGPILIALEFGQHPAMPSKLVCHTKRKLGQIILGILESFSLYVPSYPLYGQAQPRD